MTVPSQITLEPDASLTITPRILPIDARQNILKMEIILSDPAVPQLPAALIQYMLIANVLAHEECTGKEYATDNLYVCDNASIISETQVSYLESLLSTGKRFNSIMIPFDDEFSGRLSMFLQDNRGITLSAHSNTAYNIAVTSEDGESQSTDRTEPTPEIPVPEIPVPEIPVPEIPVPEIPVPEIPVPEIPVPLPVDPYPGPDTPEPKRSYNIFEQIIRWFQSLFG